jgi:hypothetical protein
VHHEVSAKSPSDIWLRKGDGAGSSIAGSVSDSGDSETLTALLRRILGAAAARERRPIGVVWEVRK